MRSICRDVAAVALVAVTLGLFASPVRAVELVETFDPGKPKEQVLGGILTTGQDGAWEASLADGAYVLRNATDGQAVKYVSINSFAGDTDGLASAFVTVDIDIADTTDLAGAGIIYRFDPASRSYLLFALLGNDEYAAFVRGPKGFKPLARGSVAGLREGANRLAVRSDGERIEFLINDVQAVGMTVRGTTGKSVGLAAIGKGTFTFDNLSIRDKS